MPLRDGSVRDRELSGGTSGVNLATIIDPHPDDAPALVAHGRTVTYGELRRDVAALRGGLAGLGIGEGDRVALVCGNGSHFAVGYFATIGLGADLRAAEPREPPARAGQPAGPRRGQGDPGRAGRRRVLGRRRPCRRAQRRDRRVGRAGRRRSPLGRGGRPRAARHGRGSSPTTWPRSCSPAGRPGGRRPPCSATATSDPTSTRACRPPTGCGPTTWCSASCPSSTSSA